MVKTSRMSAASSTTRILSPDKPISVTHVTSDCLASKTNANGPRSPRLYTWRAMRSDVSASVVESLDDAVVVIDDGRVIVAWNAAMEQVTGCVRADALGRPVDEALAALSPAFWDRPI